MRVTAQINTGYNPRRFGKPWIARVTDWPVGNNAELEWGGYLGGSDNGGVLEIDAAPGDVVRYGQRDNRNGSRTWSTWGVVQSDGTLQDNITEAEAREAFLSPTNPLDQYTIEDLRAEIERRESTESKVLS